MDEQGALVPAPPSVVLDTNTVLDMLLFVDPCTRILTTAVAAGRLRWIATPRMRDELLGVLRRPRMGRWAPPEAAGPVLAFAEQWMRMQETPPAGAGPTCRDPADQPFIDLAWTHSAKWLLTRDKALLRLARRARERGVTICPPAAWSDLPDGP